MLNLRNLKRFSHVIQKVHAREILDSRGNPTVEVDLFCSTGGLFRAAVPSGASTGIYEAHELRDKDAARYLGKGVQHAVDNVNKIIAPRIQGKKCIDQVLVDEMMYKELDGSQNEWGYSKSKLGANAILAVSLALARAGAHTAGKPLYQYLSELAGKTHHEFVLPVPSLNIINGGEHAGNKLAFQEFMVLPTGAHSFKEGIRMGAEVYHTLQKLIKTKYGKASANVGDEGGFGVPQILDENETLELIMEAIDKSGHLGKIEIGLDVAASEFYNEGKYDVSKKLGDSSRVYNAEQMVDLYESLVKKYPIVTIEDPFDQDDFKAYQRIQE